LPISLNVKLGGDDVPKFEPIRRLNLSNLDKSIQKLRKIYREKPEWFEIPVFAQKTY
jgi:hypothetical protein